MNKISDFFEKMHYVNRKKASNIQSLMNQEIYFYNYFYFFTFFIKNTRK